MMKFKVEFNENIEDYEMLIIGNSKGYRCAYIGLPKGHNLEGFDYNEIRDIHAYDGLSYSGYSEDDDRGIIKEHMEYNKWVLGFATIGVDDRIDPILVKELNPENISSEILFEESMSAQGGEIKTLDFVKKELTKLLIELRTAKWQ